MRYPELDIARGFTVMLMPAVHVTMLYGNELVYHSWLGIFLNWIAEFPGAQLFMLLMGMSFSFSHKSILNNILTKMGKWLLIGYLLNIGKFILPAFFGWLPLSFYLTMGLTAGTNGYLRLFLLGDIMQFAALSLGCMILLNKYAVSSYIIFIIAAFIIVLSPLAWQVKIPGTAVNEIISLITGNDPLVFFPVFPWAVYPLTGLMIGRQLKEARLNYLCLAVAGLSFMLPQIISKCIILQPQNENLYRSLPLQTLYHLGFCFCWLWFCSIIAKAFKRNIFIVALNWCSKHITLIYVTQWILIFWCTAFLPYRGLNIKSTLFYILLLTGIIMMLTNFIAGIINRKQHK